VHVAGWIVLLPRRCACARKCTLISPERAQPSLALALARLLSRSRSAARLTKTRPSPPRPFPFQASSARAAVATAAKGTHRRCRTQEPGSSRRTRASAQSRPSALRSKRCGSGTLSPRARGGAGRAWWWNEP
jgi:hypothetical protein